MGKLDVRDYWDYRERWWGVWRVPYWLRKSLVRAVVRGSGFDAGGQAGDGEDGGG